MKMNNKNRKFHTPPVEPRFGQRGNNQGRSDEIRHRDELAYTSVLKILG